MATYNNIPGRARAPTFYIPKGTRPGVRDYVAIMQKYCADVVSGEVVAGHLLRLAVLRALADAEKAEDASYPYIFDEAKASRVCSFIERLPHVKGELANQKRLVTLEPWQIFQLTQVFGWIRKKDGKRRFRRVYDEEARKNGKALALDTIVPTPDGETTMGEVHVGDWVLDECGRPVEVVVESPIYTDHECFRVRFSNGEVIVCDGGHLWPTMEGVFSTATIANSDNPAMWQLAYTDQIVRIVRLTQIPPVPVKCLVVNSPNHVFLVGATRIPTHNSTKMSGVGLYMLTADGEEGAEVYALASSKEQAAIVWRDARSMVAKSPGLQKHFGVDTSAMSIYVRRTNSLFIPKPGKPGDGDSPHLAIVDEYHEHDTPEGYDTMYSGMGARTQPLIWVITTAGYNRAGPCYLQRAYAIDVLQGRKTDDTLFVTIFTIDEGEDWTDPRVWPKANPNLGVSVDYDNLLEAVTEAVQNPAKQVNCLTKRLNVWCSAGSRWMDMLKWDACEDPGLDLEALSYRDLRAWIGLDLASKIDVCALALIVELPDGRLGLFHKYYLAEQTVEDGSHSTHANFAAWAIDEYVTLTPGRRTDYRYIRDDINELARRFHVETVGYDPFHATQIAVELAEDGLTLVPTKKLVQPFSDAMKEVDAQVRARTLVHERNPCTAWMMSNVTAKEDKRGNIFPYKDTPENKIDGADALFYGMLRWMNSDDGPSFANPYADPEFSTVKLAETVEPQGRRKGLYGA